MRTAVPPSTTSSWRPSLARYMREIMKSRLSSSRMCLTVAPSMASLLMVMEKVFSVMFSKWPMPPSAAFSSSSTLIRNTHFSIRNDNITPSTPMGYATA